MSACNAGDLGSIPKVGRSPGEGNGNPLQYSCLENPMDGGAWEAAVHGLAKSWTQLSDFTFTFQSLIILCISAFSVVTSFSFLIVFSLFALMSLANVLSILFIISKNCL